MKEKLFALLETKDDPSSEWFMGTIDQYNNCFGYLSDDIDFIREYEEGRGSYLTFDVEI